MPLKVHRLIVIKRKSSGPSPSNWPIRNHSRTLHPYLISNLILYYLIAFLGSSHKALILDLMGYFIMDVHDVLSNTPNYLDIKSIPGKFCRNEKQKVDENELYLTIRAGVLN